MKFSLPLSLFSIPMKILVLLSALTLLASCTQPVTPPPAPVAPTVTEEVKMMKDDTMMQADEMKKDAMMTPEKVMEKAPATDAAMDSMKKDEMMKTESMVKPADTMTKEEPKMMKMSGYMNYDESKVAEALASGQKVALFFAASWCPSCRALDGAINSNLSLIPQDALIVKVDYDTSDAMKKKYGVTSQHTTVLIDKDMNLISKKLGAKTVVDILN
jgi:thiol-disulfide isomerase/thioredoxin